ncbi:hypothetical protein [Streptomyces sp. N35]|uniref:hypothetical protein n=1 Tax=Streptomyces sp. N35 TaxID=2795730 RepID=UPI0018F4D5FC|nr:hypothetical protein [Streptomyces sp. N35]
MTKTVQPCETMTVEPVAQQHVEILRLAGTPHLSNHFDLTIAPYAATITYRREADASEYSWDATVSGYRVPPNGVADMESRSIHVWGGPCPSATPNWLLILIKRYAPDSW